MSRLPSGGLIDRSQTLSFSFDGKRYTGHPGDTLASALLANGVNLVGRSFKYHRPRGILTAGPQEPNALVTVGEGAHADPNCRATMVPLSEGLVATSQNRWPSLRHDLMAINQLASPLFVAGFYYKTFMWPAKAWEKLYEPLIRRAAGLGALSGLPDPDSYDREHAFCDLLVVGAGPAGLAAALAGARAGLRVIIADEGLEPGGWLLSAKAEVDGRDGAVWARAAAARLDGHPNVRVLPRTTVFGAYDDGEFGAVQHLTGSGPRQRYWKVVAVRTILATGAIERPIAFAGNDRPGVMMASAAVSYANRFGVAAGQRAVVFTSTDAGHLAARDLAATGVTVAAIVDPRGSAAPDTGLTVIHGVVAQVRGSQVKGAVVRHADGREEIIVCDLVAMSGGWNPNIGLAAHHGHKPVWAEAIHSFIAGELPQGMQVAGAAAGCFGLGDALAEGHRSAAAVASDLGGGDTGTAPGAANEPSGVGACWHVPISGTTKGKAFVDFQHDVTTADVELAASEGFTSVEHLKRYTTLGMATDQGQSSQLIGHALLGDATGRAIADVGTIRARPPVFPVAIGALAGHHRGPHFRPARLTPSHALAVELGAPFVDAAGWKRAQYYPRAGESHWRQSVDREVNAVRGGVGFCDVSTLGKIDLFGADVGILLDRLYINGFSALKVGRARYGLMLREDGLVMDDGTTSRLTEDHWYLTTTTANAGRVMQHIDYARQVLWPDLDVAATSATEQWACFSVAGPQSRKVLRQVFTEDDLGTAAVPHMGVLATRWQEQAARIFRLSFSGELAYEVAVPAPLGEALARRLLELGATPYGTEALGVMRIEKGHAAGGELNGNTTAADLGLGRMMSAKKDFIGKAMAARPGLADPARPMLVGLRPVDGRSPIRAGAHLLAKGSAAVAAHDLGHVTSACFSPTLGHPIALALLAHGRKRLGETIVVHDPVRGGDVLAVVCDPVFVDPQGEHLHG